MHNNESHTLTDRLRCGYPSCELSDEFIQRPIPMVWISQVAKLPGKTINVAIALWWVHCISGGGEINLTRKALTLLNVNRETANDALERMERAGLIDVVRNVGMRHKVLILVME